MTESQDIDRRRIWGEAFAAVIAQTSLPPEFATRFAADFWHIADTQAEMQILRRALLHREWHWPAFDRWAGEFSAKGKWPAMWEGYARARTEADEEGMQEERVAILRHTLITTAWKAWRLAEDLRSGGYGLNDKYFLDIAPVGDEGGAVELEVASAFREAINAGDHSQLPPFFPGDRTGLARRSREG